MLRLQTEAANLYSVNNYLTHKMYKMELKTKVNAKEAEQQLLVTRQFNLPVEMLFKAFSMPELLGQWMGTQVLVLENHPLGKYQFETRNAEGEIVFQAMGTIHGVTPNKQIIRTFEMLNTPFAPQLEFLDFIPINEYESELRMQMIYRTRELRDQMLKMPFASGISKAHDRLEALMQKELN